MQISHIKWPWNVGERVIGCWLNVGNALLSKIHLSFQLYRIVQRKVIRLQASRLL